MAEEYKNYNEEVDDMDADIEEKEALIQEAKEVEANEELTENEKIDRAEDLRRRFRRIHFSQSVYEEQLHDQFETVLDKIYAKRDEQIQKSVALKEDLIKRAKELADSDQWKQTTEKMKTLMDGKRLVMRVVKMMNCGRNSMMHVKNSMIVNTNIGKK